MKATISPELEEFLKTPQGREAYYSKLPEILYATKSKPIAIEMNGKIHNLYTRDDPIKDDHHK